MISRKFFFVLLLVSTASVAGPRNQFGPRHRKQSLFIAPWMLSDSHKVEFDMSYDLSAPGDTCRISFVTLIPQTISGIQNITSISYSPKPSRIFERNGNCYAEFVFVDPDRHTEIKISVKAELFRYDLMTARTKGEKNPPGRRELAKFLKQEKYIEKGHKLIREIAAGIEGETDIDIAKNVYEYVTDNLDYAAAGGRGIGAVKALQRGEGDCTEYSDLFVAICRAKDVPARVVTGYTVRTDSKSPRHNWVEVYLRGYGWVPFDPASGDIRNKMIRGRTFSRMWPVYVYLSHIRNDDVLGKYSFAAYRYWGDRIKVKDSVEFKWKPFH